MALKIRIAAQESKQKMWMESLIPPLRGALLAEGCASVPSQNASCWPFSRRPSQRKAKPLARRPCRAPGCGSGSRRRQAIPCHPDADDRRLRDSIFLGRLHRREALARSVDSATAQTGRSFFVSIGVSSDYRALSGHWMLMFLILAVAIVSKLVGCGLAALGSGMDWVRSLRNFYWTRLRVRTPDQGLSLGGASSPRSR